MPKPKRVGHLVLNVRDVGTSTKFYMDVLGFEMSYERPGFGSFLTCGKIHHDLALFQAKEDAAPVTPGGLGLNHMALQVENFDVLTEFHTRLKELGLVDHTTDHMMTKSIYLTDPDGNGVELFCNSFEDPADGRAMMASADRKNKELIFS